MNQQRSRRFRTALDTVERYGYILTLFRKTKAAEIERSWKEKGIKVTEEEEKARKMKLYNECRF